MVKSKFIFASIGAAAILLIAGSVSAYYLYILPKQNVDKMAFEKQKYEDEKKEKQQVKEASPNPVINKPVTKTKQIQKTEPPKENPGSPLARDDQVTIPLVPQPTVIQEDSALKIEKCKIGAAASANEKSSEDVTAFYEQNGQNCASSEIVPNDVRDAIVDAQARYEQAKANRMSLETSLSEAKREWQANPTRSLQAKVDNVEFEITKAKTLEYQAKTYLMNLQGMALEATNQCVAALTSTAQSIKDAAHKKYYDKAYLECLSQ